MLTFITFFLNYNIHREKFASLNVELDELSQRKHTGNHRLDEETGHQQPPEAHSHLHLVFKPGLKTVVFDLSVSTSKGGRKPQAAEGLSPPKHHGPGAAPEKAIASPAVMGRRQLSFSGSCLPQGSRQGQLMLLVKERSSPRFHQAKFPLQDSVR